MAVECKRCFYNTDHPLGLVIDDEGICSGCRVHEEKDALDWKERFFELEKLLLTYRNSSRNYDCIVPVSGAKDSFFIIHIVKNILKLNPLLVSYNKLFNSQIGIENLANLRNTFKCDLIQKTVNPNIVKKITRRTIYKFGNPYWHCLAGETVYPVQVACSMNIPLIIWGAHQGLEQVGMFSHLDNVEMTRKYRKDHDLFGYEAQNLSDTYDDIHEDMLINFLYPPFSDIEKTGVKGIYLGNYIRWDPYLQHIEMVKKYNYKGRICARNFECYDYADSLIYSDFHDLLKYYKHGYSKVTDHVCREIRFGRISRNNGKKLINYYSNQEPENIDIFCNWLGVDRKALQMVADNHRNNKYWKKVDFNKWKKIDQSNIPENSKKLSSMQFPNSKKIIEKSYTTVGKGTDWPKEKQYKSHNWI